MHCLSESLCVSLVVGKLGYCHDVEGEVQCPSLHLDPPVAYAMHGHACIGEGDGGEESLDGVPGFVEVFKCEQAIFSATEC